MKSKMKQMNFAILLTVLMSMTGAKAFAYDVEVANADGVTIYYNYINDGTELEVTHSYNDSYPYTGSYSGNVKIPESVKILNETRKVTSIGDFAFASCSDLTAVTIPESVTSIGEVAFWGCVSLTSITIPDGVTSIGEGAFADCVSLTSITIPDGVTSISNETFSGCVSLTSITIPEGVTSIGYRVFYKCNVLSITIPASVTSIGYDAFEDGPKKIIVKDLAAWCNISFDSSPLEYARHLYSDEDTEITDLIIPDGVTNINTCAFSDCDGLVSVTIPGNVKNIGDAAFRGCKGLTSVNISDGVMNIGINAFGDCESLTSVIIPESVMTIGAYAFSWCSALTSVTIHEGVITIGELAFQNCKSLTSVIIPESVMTIGDMAFAGCSSLNYFEFGSAVETIGNETFEGCWAMTQLISHAVTPPTCGSKALDGIDKTTCTLSVPRGYAAVYQQAEQWKDFLFINDNVNTSEIDIAEKKTEALTACSNAQDIFNECVYLYFQDGWTYYEQVAEKSKDNQSKADSILAGITTLEQKIAEAGITDKAIYQQILETIRENVSIVAVENRDTLASNQFCYLVEKYCGEVKDYGVKVEQYEEYIEAATTNEALDALIAEINQNAANIWSTYYEPVKKEYEGLVLIEPRLIQIGHELDALKMQLQACADEVDAIITGISVSTNPDAETVIVYTIGSVSRTMKKADLHSLPKGIYIVNGKKHIVK